MVSSAEYLNWSIMTHAHAPRHTVASALASPLRLNEEMLSLVLRKSNKESADEPMRKMCMLPANSKLLYLEGADEWPVSPAPLLLPTVPTPLGSCRDGAEEGEVREVQAFNGRRWFTEYSSAWLTASP